MFKGKVKEEIVQVKRKGFVENMNKTVITKEKIEEKKEIIMDQNAMWIFQ